MAPNEPLEQSSRTQSAGGITPRPASTASTSPSVAAASPTWPSQPGGSSSGSGAAPGSSATTDLVGQLREQATARLSDQKNQAAATLTSLVEAVRHTGQQLEEKNATLAKYAETTAGELERWSSQLKDRDVPQLLDDAKHFARRRPGVFLGISAAVGLLAVRFLKSSKAEAHVRSTAGNGPHAAYSGYPVTPRRPPTGTRSTGQEGRTSTQGGVETSSWNATSGVPSTPKRRG
jgi:hypothetical protein